MRVWAYRFQNKFIKVTLFIVHYRILSFFDNWMNMFMNMFRCINKLWMVFKGCIETLRESSKIIRETHSRIHNFSPLSWSQSLCWMTMIIFDIKTTRFTNNKGKGDWSFIVIDPLLGVVVVFWYQTPSTTYPQAKNVIKSRNLEV